MINRNIFILIILLVILNARVECDTNVNFGFIYKNIKNDTDYFLQILGPLYRKTSTKFGAEENIIFFNKSDNFETRQKNINFLYPIFRYKKDNSSENISLLPLYSKVSVKHYDDTEYNDIDSFIFPLIFYGNDKKEGNYFAFVPLFGNMKGKLGKDEIEFYLLPIYLKTKYKNDEIYHIMYPLISYANNEDLKIKKFFPFFGTVEKKNSYQKKFLMFPFYSEKKIFYKNNEYNSHYYFPVYASEHYPVGSYRSYLYPIFRYKIGDAKNNFSFLPFVIKEKSPIYTKKYYSLFYGIKEDLQNNKTIGYYLLPFGYFQYGKTVNYNYENYYFLPLVKYYKKDDKQNNESELLQVFPIFKVDKKNNTRNIAIPSLDIFIKNRYMEQKYSYWWELINITSSEDLLEINMFWSFIEFSKNKKNKETKIELNPIFKYAKFPDHSTFGLFFNLIKWKM